MSKQMNSFAGSARGRILVIGHKNPDTDSICSAIAYAALMNASGEEETEYIPCRAGELNPETRFVLERYHFPVPVLTPEVRAKVSDLEIRQEPGISPHLSIREAWDRMKENATPTLPVIDEDGTLLGVISVKDIAIANMDALDSRMLSRARAPISNILKTIGGELINGSGASLVERGRVTIGASTPEAMRSTIDPGDIVIVGNRIENALCAIEMQASLVIVCNAQTVSEMIAEIARLHGCTVIRTPHETYTVSRLLNQSIPVSNFMKTDVTCFEMGTDIDQVKDTMSSVRYDYFPVLEDGRVAGLISKRNLISLRKKRLALVDHNERSQCVDGFDEAEIVAIIDHHRIGDIETKGPVFFRNVPVGCTSTILYDMFRERGTEISPALAGIMCCAILSDTLAFRSPTCTGRDIAAAQALAGIAGEDPAKLASEMFDAGENLSGKTPEGLFYNDIKIFKSGDVRIAIAQGVFNSPSNLERACGMISEFIDRVPAAEHVDLVFYLATSIPAQFSRILYAGNGAEALLRRSFKTDPEAEGIRVPGLVSRKKQFVPALLGALEG